MNIEVEHKDQSGNITQKNFNLSRLALVKHLAIAGMHYAPKPQKLLRAFGMFFHYGYYLQRNDFYSDKFSSLPAQISDPTEKGQFSTLVGRAIADYLSKKIDNSLFTVNYEAEMRMRKMSIKG
ncbi:MAG: hypothetical protein ACK40M_01640, partial [Flavobacteriales bacterium]